MKRELQIATLPVVALRGLVIFPKMMLHFDIGRKKSAAALNAAMEGEREIFLVAQKDLQEDDPKHIGCNFRRYFRVIAEQILDVAHQCGLI